MSAAASDIYENQLLQVDLRVQISILKRNYNRYFVTAINVLCLSRGVHSWFKLLLRTGGATIRSSANLTPSICSLVVL
jgi:hypothetical protein